MNTVVTQALATGLPVITTRHSGLPEQVVDGENGFLVDEGDYRALAERILTVAEHPELLTSLSERSRGHVELHYDAGILIERQIDAYEEVAAAAGKLVRGVAGSTESGRLRSSLRQSRSSRGRAGSVDPNDDPEHRSSDPGDRRARSSRSNDGLA